MDRRCSESLGGPRRAHLERNKGPWFSLDLEKSTDYHPFWLERVAYEELLEYLPEIREYYLPFFDKLFGPRKLLEYGVQIPEVPLLTFEGRELDLGDIMGVLFDTHTRSPSKLDVPEEDLWKLINDWSARYIEWIDDINKLPGTITKRGAMMGDATSWALLPLSTIFVCESVGIQDPETCGDDALIPEFEDPVVEPFKQKFEGNLGGKINWKKSFRHATRGLFREIPYEDGRRIHYELLSFWIGPYGGTKGEMHWFNQPGAFAGFYQHMGYDRNDRPLLRRRGLWKFSKFFYEWKLAQRLGIPLGATEQFGGISHPFFPKYRTVNYREWTTAISSTPVLDWLRGGFSLIPPPQRGPGFGRYNSDINQKRLYRNFRSSDPVSFPTIPGFAKEPILLEDFFALESNSRSILGLFNPGSFREIRSTPSIVNLAEMLDRRIKGKTSGKRLFWSTVEGLERDVLRKREVYSKLPPSDFHYLRPFGVSRGNQPRFIPRPWYTPGLGW